MEEKLFSLEEYLRLLKEYAEITGEEE